MRGMSFEFWTNTRRFMKSTPWTALLLGALACHTPPRPPDEGSTPSTKEDVVQNPSDPRERAKELVSRMSLEEKIAYLGGDRDFFIRPVERLGIPEIKMSDGPSGCRNWGPSTAYPASIGIAAAFDPGLARRVGASIGRDCRARGVHILLAPGVNIQRSPLNGRNFEYLGEDPLLAEKTVVGTIKGVQGQGVLATVKHYVANNQEWDRHHVSSEISERALREIYLPAFEGAVKEAKVGAVMTSYNLINGSFGSHNSYLLRTILRDEWGFDGIVVSDWGAVHDTLGAVRGGTDLEMPRAAYMSGEKLLPLLEAGTIKEEEIDEKVENLLTTLITAGFFDHEQKVDRPVDDPESAKVALEAARRSLVLLKNESKDGSALLPLPPTTKKIAVIGPNAHPAVHGGSGSAYVTPSHAVSLVEGLRQLLPEAEVVTHPGIRQTTGFSSLGAPVFAGPVKQEIFANKDLSGTPKHVAEVDRVDFQPSGKSPAEGIGAEHYSIRWTGKVRVEEPRSYKLLTNADDGVRVFVDGQKVLDDWSDHAPRVRTAEVSLKAGQHDVIIEYFQGILGAICQFGFGSDETAGKQYGRDEVVRLAREADVVVLAVGYGQSRSENSLGTSFEPFWPPGWAREAGIVEAEDDDRDFSLPAPQVETIRAVTDVNPQTIVVGFAGGGVNFEPWLEKVPALLWAWYPGQEGGTALAEVLLGKENPSGHLPVTFARNYADHPAATSYGLGLPLASEHPYAAPDLKACAGAVPPQGSIKPQRTEKDEGPLYLSPYCEDVFVGYRGFDRAKTEPLFPFGFGLSYTSFEYENLSVRVDQEGDLQARVTVKNTGPLAGRDVVQLYAAPEQTDDRPLRQLAGFVSVALEPGQAKTVEIPLSTRAFSVYRTEKQPGWFLPSGAYVVTASHSSREHAQSVKVQLNGREPDSDNSAH